MAEKKFRVEITEGPGEMDLFLKALRYGEIIYFTLNSEKKRKCSVRIDGLCDGGRREVWKMEGQLEMKPGVWVKFNNSIYDPKTREGYFIFPLQEEEDLEEHPVCLHLVPKGSRYCPECGRDRQDVG